MVTAWCGLILWGAAAVHAEMPYNGLQLNGSVINGMPYNGMPYNEANLGFQALSAENFR